jgi:hypothetical protein
LKIWNAGAPDRLDELVAVGVVHHDPLDPTDAYGLAAHEAFARGGAHPLSQPCGSR